MSSCRSTRQHYFRNIKVEELRARYDPLKRTPAIFHSSGGQRIAGQPVLDIDHRPPKRQIREQFQHTLLFQTRHPAATMEEDAGLRFGQNAFGSLFASADKSEGMKAFLEKREPKWQHK